MPAESADKKTAGNGVRFWEEKSLEDLTSAEWEALCDRCALCCAHKVEDAETGEVHYLDQACSLLDPETRICRRYDERTEVMPDCARLTPERVRAFDWLPSSCAYRCVAEGRPLPDWHPLQQGGIGTVRA